MAKTKNVQDKPWVLSDEAKRKVVNALSKNGYLALRIKREETNILVIQGTLDGIPIVELGMFRVAPGDFITLENVEIRLD